MLQFPWFNKYEIQADEFFLRLRFFLQRLKDLPAIRYVVEIRNRAWLGRLADLLREYNVALALTDISRMPRPWEKKKFDWVTIDFVYVRWLGDRKGMETLTTTWDKTIINRSDDLEIWAGLFRKFVSRNLKVYAYANNHSPYQAVLLANGAVYFGQLQGYGGKNPVLTNVFYVVSQTNPDTNK